MTGGVKGGDECAKSEGYKGIDDASENEDQQANELREVVSERKELKGKVRTAMNCNFGYWEGQRWGVR